MIKAELDYNPYLLETKIKFNGQSPRINSLVEKYEAGALRDWIDLVPKIFYDEMNGYDFELEFSGTERDFGELKDVFKRNGITEEQVHLFHKNVLACRNDKIEKIDELLQWLKKNKNSHFDYNAFCLNNKELLEGPYSFVIINGRDLDISSFDNSDVSAELIDDLTELEHTVLEDTPILINVSEDNYRLLTTITSNLLGRDDVSSNQLFFSVEKTLNPDMVERTIVDIGIENPQIVKTVDDEKILRYLELYPFSDYIHDVISTMRIEVTSLTERLDEQNKISAATNKEIYEEIEELDRIISKLKRIQEKFENDYNAEMPQLWMADEDSFLRFIQEWRIKKTKINKTEEAERSALEFESEVKEMYSKYLSSIDELFSRSVEDLNTEYASWYSEAEYNDEFIPEIENIEKPDTGSVPSFEDDLINMKEEKYVLAKESIIDKFFKDTADNTKEMVLETTYYLQKWRDHAYVIFEPLAHKVLTDYFDTICDYEKRLINSYIDHLSKALTKENKKRDTVSQQLSDEEKQLQKDNDWLRDFDDKLRGVERS